MALSIFLHMLFNFFGGGLSQIVGAESSAYLSLIYFSLLPFGLAALYALFLRHRYDPPKSSRLLAYPFKGLPAFYENVEQRFRVKGQRGQDVSYQTYGEYIEPKLINLEQQKLASKGKADLPAENLLDPTRF